MFPRVKKSGGYEYLQIVENRREAGKVRQQVIASLGRLDELTESGKLDDLTHGLSRFCKKIRVFDAHREGELESLGVRRIGPALVFERLWTELGIGRELKRRLGNRKFEFPVERAVFLTVLHRLFVSGSDRAAEKWREDYRVEGAEGLDLHHLYRAMAWLGERLPKKGQKGATPFAPRCTKDLIEEGLFDRRRDLFSSLDLVFFDTTSLYFEGEGGQSIGRRGKSKDHRPDLKQMVVGVVLDGDGRPVCCELWPGNTSDVKTLIPVVERLQSRFHIGSVCVVSDRGMISSGTMEELERRGLKYILGARMRKMKEVRDKVLSHPGRYRTVHPPSGEPKAPAPLKVKEVVIREEDRPDRRYVVCFNENQARKDAADREAIVEGLKKKLQQGEKELIGNKGFRRYVKTQGERFAIDEEKIRSEVRYDGKWVLKTNTTLPTEQVALKYKQLWMVEQLFRTTKSILETRPVYHKCDETIRGHVFCSFLALVLKTELFERLEKKGDILEWNDIRRDLEALQETEVNLQGETYHLRSPLKGTCHKALQATGVAVPPSVRR
jgi:hypothetical protein